MLLRWGLVLLAESCSQLSICLLQLMNMRLGCMQLLPQLLCLLLGLPGLAAITFRLVIRSSVAEGLKSHCCIFFSETISILSDFEISSLRRMQGTLQVRPILSAARNIQRRLSAECSIADSQQSIIIPIRDADARPRLFTCFRGMRASVLKAALQRKSHRTALARTGSDPMVTLAR